MSDIQMIAGKKRISFTAKVDGKNRKVIVNKDEASDVFESINKMKRLSRSVDNIYQTVKKWVRDNEYISIEKRTPQYYYIVED